MNDSNLYSKFSALPENLKVLAAEFIEFLLQKAEAAGTSQPSKSLPAEGAELSLEEQIAAENKLLDEEFERVLQGEGGPMRPQDLRREENINALKSAFPITPAREHSSEL